MVKTPRSTLRLWAEDLFGLFIPRRCAGCDDTLMRFEEVLCTGCITELPFTRFHEDPRNRVEQLFMGKVELEAASALLHFAAGGMVQRILHRVKYAHDLEAGQLLGGLMARDLAGSARFATVDALLAVPLHAAKERKRGYNQSQLLVDGIREEWGRDNPKHALRRAERTTTQTRKGRMDRWRNVKDAFVVADPAALQGRHVLLIDDVVTTGATIEACALAMSELPGTRVSVFAAACA